jgi:hypothetical protein
MSERPPDVPEPDVQEQSRDWDEKDVEEPTKIPLDDPEADVLDQQRPAELDDEDAPQP